MSTSSLRNATSLLSLTLLICAGFAVGLGAATIRVPQDRPSIQDGIDEIIIGAGPGIDFGPHVRGWNYDGSSISSLPGYSFFAWDTASEPLWPPGSSDPALR